MNSKSINFLILFSLLFFSLLSGCKKEKYIELVDNYSPTDESLSNSSIAINAAGIDFIELEWPPVTSSTFEEIKYDLYLDDQLIINDITTNIYTVINLPSNTEHQIKVIAKSKSGKSIEIKGSAKTLQAKESNIDTFYKEFQLFERTRLTGATTAYNLKDGGNIITRQIQHPNRYEYDTFKIVTFRMDSSGNILWYRLFSTYDYPVNFYSHTTVVDEDINRAIVMSGQVMWQIDLETGQKLLTKVIQTEIGEYDLISSTRYTNDKHLLVGTTDGKLFEVDFQTLSIRWKQENHNYKQAVKSILQDSKGFLYYISADNNKGALTVHKASSTGEFIQAFKFDGKLNGEYDHDGYAADFMTIDKEDHIYLFGRNYYTSTHRHFKFTTDGDLILKNEQYNKLYITSGFFDKEDNLIIYGSTQGVGIDIKAWIYKYDKSMNLIKTISYPQLPMHGFNAVNLNRDGSFNIFLSYVTTYSYENDNFVYIKTRQDGTF